MITAGSDVVPEGSVSVIDAPAIEAHRMFSTISMSPLSLQLFVPCLKGLTYVPKDHSAGGKESLNRFEPRLGVAPASLIVTSVASLPCEKLYPSKTPILKVFTTADAPVPSPLPLKSPSAVLELSVVVVPVTPFTVTISPLVPLPVEAVEVAVSLSTNPDPLKLFGK